ncbi:MAG TPA: oxidoreductase, partial [Polyangia bacterium]|nr:oxidoreductase [Polyangia bacterium]
MFAPVAIAAVRPETHEMCLVRLELGGTPFAAAYTTPGQYVIARTRGSEGRFAFASAPSARDGVDILVKHGGTVADALCTAAPGAKVEISRPGGKGFPIAQANGHGVILCAAGSGVGPIRAVVQVLLARRADYGPITLFHGQRGHGDFAFASEHAAWEHGGIRVIKVHSRP